MNPMCSVAVSARGNGLAAIAFSSSRGVRRTTAGLIPNRFAIAVSRVAGLTAFDAVNTTLPLWMSVRTSP